MGKLLVFILVVVSLLAIGGLLYRPATVIGTSEKSLASSVRGVANADKTGPCAEHADDRFTCAVYDPDSQNTVPYDVKVDKYGCWDATSSQQGNDTRPQTLSGCITIIDLARGD